MQSDERERRRRQARLQFEADEITAARLRPGEEDEIRSERELLVNSERLSELAEAAYAALEGGGRSGAAVDALGRVADALVQLAQLDPRMEETAGGAAALQDQAADLARSLRAYSENIEFSPSRLATLEERLSLINQLKRKYGVTVEEVIAYGERDAIELDEVAHGEERRDSLQHEERALLDAIADQGSELGRAREAGALRLAVAVEKQLADLHMAGARFAVRLSRRPAPDGVVAALNSEVVAGTDSVHSAAPGAAFAFDLSGVDRVEFLVSLNPGEPLLPLARVASGGETSRLMLALKTVLGEADDIPTLVFDEIEAGLGGRSGGVVGEKLAALADHHQVICITHLPQIAAAADVHLVASKAVGGGRTRAHLEPLDAEARVHELAAMLGTVTPATLVTAREMIAARGVSDQTRAARVV
jgi:DNA repair protein RecN (Recombination protein N)